MRTTLLALASAAVLVAGPTKARADDAPPAPTHMRDPALVVAGSGFFVASALATAGSIALVWLTPACTPELLGCVSHEVGYFSAGMVGALGVGAAIVGAILVARGAKRVPEIAYVVTPNVLPRGGGATMTLRF